MDDITQVDVPDMKVLGMRRIGAYPDVGRIMPELFSHIMSSGIQMAGPPAYLCHELTMDEVNRAMRDNDADLEVVVPVSGEVKETAEIKTYTIPGGRMARIVHKGPYDKVGETYTKVFAWLDRNGKIVMGPYREIYLNSPMEVSPEELLTEIQVPI